MDLLYVNYSINTNAVLSVPVSVRWVIGVSARGVEPTEHSHRCRRCWLPSVFVVGIVVAIVVAIAVGSAVGSAVGIAVSMSIVYCLLSIYKRCPVL